MCNESTPPNITWQHPDTPSFRGVIYIYIFSSVLFFIFNILNQSLHLFSDLISVLIVSEFAFIVAPALIYTILNRYNLSRTFHITPIRFTTVLIVIITTIAAFFLVAVIAALQGMIFPPSEDYKVIWEFILREFHRVPLVITLFLMSVMPGVCEELLFRGFLLHGMRKKCSDRSAIIIVGFLFGALHLDPYRFFPISLLGIVFGYMVVKTGSIFSGIVAHSTNNAIIVVLSYAALTAQNSDILLSPPPQSEQITALQTLILVILVIVMTLIALTVFLLGLRALPRAPVTGQPPGRIEENPLFAPHEKQTEDREEER